MAKIGVIADTHDNMNNVREAVKFFKAQGIDCLIHAGDYVAPFVLNELLKLKCEFHGVYGNNDGEREGLFAKSEGRICQPPAIVRVGGKKILILHDLEAVGGMKKVKNCDICIHAHTHKPQIKKVRNVLFVNPGECCGWVTEKASVVIIDTKDMSASIHHL